MTIVRKPGADTLVYFWFAVALSVLGLVIGQIGSVLLLRGELERNILHVSTLHLVAWGCYTGALIFTIVVMHKVIAMLIYLVHHHRLLPPRTFPTIRNAPVAQHAPDEPQSAQLPSTPPVMPEHLAEGQLPSGSKLNSFPRQALGAVQPQDQQQGAEHHHPGDGKDIPHRRG